MLPIKGSSPPKTAMLGMKGIFKPNVQNIKTLVLSKLLYHNQILHNDK